MTSEKMAPATLRAGGRYSKRNALEKCLRLIVLQGTYPPLHSAAVYVREMPMLGILTDRRRVLLS